jgi:hypothetical protein
LTNISLPANYAWQTPTTAVSAGNSQTFTALYTDPSGNYEAATGNVTVNVAKATPTVTYPTQATVQSGAALSTAVFSGGSSSVSGTFAFASASTVPALANSNTTNYALVFTPTDNTNYNTATKPDMKVTVVLINDAAFVSISALSVTYTAGLTLAGITLPANYVWQTPATAIGAGNSQTYTAIYTDPSGNYEAATGNVTVNVAKAAGTFVTTSAVSATYTAGLTLASITLPANYAWQTPATAISAGNGQTFTAIYTNPSGNYNAATGNVTVNVTVNVAQPTAVGDNDIHIRL